MSDLSDEQLRAMAAWLPHHVEQKMASELVALRARVAELEAELRSLDNCHRCEDYAEERAALHARVAELERERDEALGREEGGDALASVFKDQRDEARARVAELEAALGEAQANVSALWRIGGADPEDLAPPAESGRRDSDDGLPTANDVRGILGAPPAAEAQESGDTVDRFIQDCASETVEALATYCAAGGLIDRAKALTAAIRAGKP